MSQTNSSSRLAPWQAMTMLAVGIAIIFFGLMALKVNARIVLAVDGAIMCLMACAFGISYDSVQKGIKDTIASMLVAMLILLSIFSRSFLSASALEGSMKMSLMKERWQA